MPLLSHANVSLSRVGLREMGLTAILICRGSCVTETVRTLQRSQDSVESKVPPGRLPLWCGGGIEIQGPIPTGWRERSDVWHPGARATSSHTSLYTGSWGGRAVAVVARAMGQNLEIWAEIELCHLLTERA